MAGVRAVVEGLSDGSWFRCSDGNLLEPADVLALLFPNEGRNATGDNVCFVPRHLTFPLLRALLPNPSEYFVPDDLVDAIVALIILCTLVTAGLVLCKAVWEKIDPRFAAITPPHKKWYVVANLSKAFFLACLFFGQRYWIRIYRGYYLDEFETIAVKRLSVIYSATDVVALYLVPKLPKSTIVHHVATAILCMTVSSIDMTAKGWGGLLGVAKMALLYGTLSDIAFSVNAYLALRVVYPKAKWQARLVSFSLWTYMVCCAMNWTAHVVWFAGLIMTMDISIATIAYVFIVAMVVHDDVMLMKWLKNRPLASWEHSIKKE